MVEKRCDCKKNEFGVHIIKIRCKYCKKETEHKHKYGTAHGMPETFNVGTEHYECVVCENGIYKGECDKEDKKLKFPLEEYARRA